MLTILYKNLVRSLKEILAGTYEQYEQFTTQQKCHACFHESKEFENFLAGKDFVDYSVCFNSLFS